MTRKNHLHEIKAFAAFSNRGDLLYATIKQTRAEAQAELERFNPNTPQGYFEVQPIYIGVDKGFQYDIEKAINESG